MLQPIQKLAQGLLFCAFLGLGLAPLGAQDNRGRSVVVVYNSSMPESKGVAEHYAAARHVPPEQVIGFDLPRGEQISRDDFAEKLQRPLWRALKERNLITYESGGELGRRRSEPKFAGASIRYLVLCYGVPVKIARDSGIHEDGLEKLPPELQPRNEAAVDSELALLPVLPAQPTLAGPLPNPLFAQTNGFAFSPTNGILMTARLDGPSAELARGLVDKALLAEKQGLWGRAYFDLRGITDTAYKLGDELIDKTSQAARHYGFEVVLDRSEATFSSGFPMPDTALYFGWYVPNLDGPFASGFVNFVPGAIAYHLHSFSASTLRTPAQHWVGPLIAKGATATFGFTDEPYLQFTPDLPVFLARMLFNGFSFGEAIYAAQGYLSWQTTVVGDPLYTPTIISTHQRFLQMSARKDPLMPWVHLLIINRNIAMKHPLSDASDYIEKTPGLADHPLLQEKLADIYKRQGMVIEAADPYLKVIEMELAPLDLLRLAINAGAMLSNLGHKEEVYDLYQRVLREFPNYPEKAMFYQRLAELATALDKKEEAERYRKLSGNSGG